MAADRHDFGHGAHFDAAPLLTPAGRALYRKAFAEASRRNQRILSALSEQDCLALFRMLDTVAAEGRVMLDEERRRNA
jgi:hypothetical protein